MTLVFGLIHRRRLCLPSLLDMHSERPVDGTPPGFNCRTKRIDGGGSAKKVVFSPVGPGAVVQGANSVAYSWSRCAWGMPSTIFTDIAASFLVGEGLTGSLADGAWIANVIGLMSYSQCAMSRHVLNS